MFKQFKGLNAKQVVQRIFTEYSFVLSFLLLVIIAASVNPNFFTWNNISNIFVQSSLAGVVAMGMTMVISAGMIDISVGSQIAIIGGFGITILNVTGSMFIFIIYCFVAGALLGTINGFLVTKGNMPPMIVTLAMQTACRSICNHFGQKGPYTVTQDLYPTLKYLAFEGIRIGTFKLPYLMILFVLVSVIFGIIMKNTRLGKHIYAVGSNTVSARLSGINVDYIKIMCFVITGIMCGLSAILYCSRMTAVTSSTTGVGYEMEAIAAVAIGGTSMSGGRGKVAGTFFGALMFKMINNILTMANVSTFLNGAISGAIIIIAVLLQNVQGKRKGT